MQFQPGDPVRLLHEPMGGRVLRQTPEGSYEVELENGFDITLSAEELVHAAPQPGKRPRMGSQSTPKKEASETSSAPAAKAPPEQSAELAEGLYLGLHALDEQRWALDLLNHRPTALVFAAFRPEGDDDSTVHGLAAGELGAHAAVRLASFRLDEQERYKRLILRWTNFAPALPALPPVQQEEVRLRSAHFKKAPANHPYGPAATLVPIQQAEDEVEETAPSPVEKNRDESSALANIVPRYTSEGRELLACEEPPTRVDLHIDELVANPQELESHDMLTMQLNIFEQCLANAVSHGYEQITFVHGQGTGKLRREIIRRLSDHPEVQQFKAEDEKLRGHGATRVLFKRRVALSI